MSTIVRVFCGMPLVAAGVVSAIVFLTCVANFGWTAPVTTVAFVVSASLFWLPVSASVVCGFNVVISLLRSGTLGRTLEMDIKPEAVASAYMALAVTSTLIQKALVPSTLTGVIAGRVLGFIIMAPLALLPAVIFVAVYLQRSGSAPATSLNQRTQASDSNTENGPM